MNDPLDNLKNIWNSGPVSTEQLDKLNRTLSERFSTSRVPSLQRRLYRRTRTVGWISMLLPLLCPLLYYTLELPLWYVICYGVYGIASGTATLLLARRINAEELAALPVDSAVRRAVSIRKTMIWTKCISFLFGAALIGTMGFLVNDLPDREILLIGFFIGLAVGICIAVPRKIKDFRLANRLTEYLQD